MFGSSSPFPFWPLQTLLDSVLQGFIEGFCLTVSLGISGRREVVSDSVLLAKGLEEPAVKLSSVV